MRAVEGKPVVDHACHEPGPATGRLLAPHHGPIEDALASIGSAGTFVEDQDGAEVREIDYLRQQRIGKEVVNSDAAGVAWVTRTELPAGLHRHVPGAKAKVDLGILAQKSRRDVNQRGLGGGDLE